MLRLVGKSATSISSSTLWERNLPATFNPLWRGARSNIDRDQQWALYLRVSVPTLSPSFSFHAMLIRSPFSKLSWSATYTHSSVYEARPTVSHCSVIQHSPDVVTLLATKVIDVVQTVVVLRGVNMVRLHQLICQPAHLGWDRGLLSDQP